MSLELAVACVLEMFSDFVSAVLIKSRLSHFKGRQRFHYVYLEMVCIAGGQDN